MKRWTAVLSVACCAMLVGAAVAVPNLTSPAPTTQLPQAQAASKAKPAKPSKKQLKAFKKASAKFSLDLFKKSVAKNGKKNTVVAPMSVLTMLALVNNGASGKTSTEMRDLLAGGASAKRLDKNLRWFNSQLTNSKNAKLESANAIWYRDDGMVTLKKKFIKANRTYFGALVEAADFSDPQTVDRINGWVSDQTNKMIPKTIDSLDKSTQTVLVNTLYFNAKWADPYAAGSSFKKTFTAANGKKKKVDMLGSTEHSYISGDGVKGFIKPYKKGYSFVALLPKKGVSLKKFTKQLTGSTFTKLVKGASQERVITTMPKLNLSYSDEKMVKLLRKMGMKRVTSQEKANLKKMGTSKIGNLYLGDVIHKTRLKLDEEGTEAAAVTAGMVKANSALVTEKPKVVTLNRPYVFAIIDNHTKLPLFVGAVNKVKQ